MDTRNFRLIIISAISMLIFVRLEQNNSDFSFFFAGVMIAYIIEYAIHSFNILKGSDK